MGDEGGKTFPSPCDSVSQSAPCFSLPSTKSNGDTEYGSEFPMSFFFAIFLEDFTNVLFSKRFPPPPNQNSWVDSLWKPVWTIVDFPVTVLKTHAHTHHPYSFESLQMGTGDTVLTRVTKVPHTSSISPVQHSRFPRAIRCCICRNTEQQ